MGTRTVALLRITPLAYAEIVESLKLCGDEGLMRIKPDGKHLDVSDLILEVDPEISKRFPQPDLSVKTRVFVGGGEKFYDEEEGLTGGLVVEKRSGPKPRGRR